MLVVRIEVLCDVECCNDVLVMDMGGSLGPRFSPSFFCLQENMRRIRLFSCKRKKLVESLGPRLMGGVAGRGLWCVVQRECGISGIVAEEDKVSI